MTLTRSTFFCLALTVASVSTWAAEKPNFSGTWEMNKAKSDFGQMPPMMVPDKLTQKIVQKGETEMRVESTTTGERGTASTDMKYKLDGSESTNKNQMGEVKSVAKWDGSQIAITSKREVQGMTIGLSEKWEVSADGKTMSVQRTMTGTPMGDVVTKTVFDKQ
ncbi:MAG: hypothetical protein K2X03_11650 [Bryobacteraceae bacterium]|nr:hypothetical protein [Bryobacteraceae bacterium]